MSATQRTQAVECQRENFKQLLQPAGLPKDSGHRKAPVGVPDSEAIFTADSPTFPTCECRRVLRIIIP